MKAQGESSEHSKVLIVEDEQTVAADLQHALTELGYVVTGLADSGPGAVELAGKSSPDVVLMDIRLQGPLNGIAAADEIRKRWQTPVVFLMASGADETLVRAREERPYGYVVKPFCTRDLNATILLALNQHRIARELFAEPTWLRTVLSSLSDGVIATDDTGHVRFMNASAEQMTGWSRADAAGKPIEAIYPVANFDGSPVDVSRLQKPVTPGTPLRKTRFLLTQKGGGLLPVEDASAPLAGAGRTEGAVIVFADIADRLRREQQQTEDREHLEEQVHIATEALGNTRAELRALSGYLMRLQEEERSRVARELHDDLGLRLAALEFTLTRLQEISTDAAAGVQEELRAATRQTADLSDTLRMVSHGLHSSVITDLGIEPALRALIDEHRRAGEDVKIVLHDIPASVPFDTSIALYRIVQEGLRNASKHAAGVPVLVELARRDADLKLSIDDSGPGFDLSQLRQKGGLGLLSIQERARLVGGTFELRSSPRQGTSLQVRVPIGRV
jgi:PAS domain S-box-containing protein